MKKIAIVKGREIYRCDPYDDYGFYENIVVHITDWEEVTDEEYEDIRRGLAMNSQSADKYSIIEYVDNPRTVMNKAVSDYKKWLKKQEADRAAYLAEQAKKKAEAAAKRAAKTQKKDAEKLKELADKLGVKVELPK